MQSTETLSEFFGVLTLIFFIVGNVYYPARQLARKTGNWTQETSRFFRRYLRLHIFLNLAALPLLIGHAWFAEESNIVLWASLGATFWLTAVGLMMHYKVPAGMGRQLRLLHTQQVMFLVWFVLVIGGHLGAE